MKYYYKDKLMRTSENEYKYASVYEDNEGHISKPLSCSKTYEGAYKTIKSEINYCLRKIDYYEQYLNAIKNGKTYFWYKNYKKTINDDAERIEHYLQYAKTQLDKKRRFYKVVELEAR